LMPEARAVQALWQRARAHPSGRGLRMRLFLPPREYVSDL
jgi:hypothetical protein